MADRSLLSLPWLDALKATVFTRFALSLGFALGALGEWSTHAATAAFIFAMVAHVAITAVLLRRRRFDLAIRTFHFECGGCGVWVEVEATAQSDPSFLLEIGERIRSQHERCTT